MQLRLFFDAGESESHTHTSVFRSNHFYCNEKKEKNVGRSTDVNGRQNGWMGGGQAICGQCLEVKGKEEMRKR